MMLFRLHQFALRLLPLRPLCLLLACTGFAVSVFALLTTASQHSQLLRMALVLTLWSLLLFAFIQLFKNIPAPVLPKDRWFVRFRTHIKLALYQLLALGVAGLGVMLISMSLKLLLL